MDARRAYEGFRAKEMHEQQEAQKDLCKLKDFSGMSAYADNIIEQVTYEGFLRLIRFGLLQFCGMIAGKTLYTF